MKNVVNICIIWDHLLMLILFYLLLDDDVDYLLVFYSCLQTELVEFFFLGGVRGIKVVGILMR